MLFKRGCRAAIFVIIFAAIFCVLSFNYARLVQNENARYNRIIEQFERSYPRVLFLGDSHSFNAIDLNELGDEYASLAYSGDNLREMFLKLDYAIWKKPKIHCVVIPLDYHLLAHYRDRNRDFSRDLRYSENIHLIAELFGTSRADVLFQNLCVRLPLMKAGNWEKYFLILTEKLERLIVPSAPELQGKWQLLDQGKRRAAAMSRIKEQLAPPVVVEDMANILDDFILFCENNKIDLIGVRYPLSMEYLELSKTFGVEKVERIYRAKANGFTAVLDYRYIFSDSPMYFFNTDHLSPQGAKAFSTILKKDIEALVKGLHG